MNLIKKLLCVSLAFDSLGYISGLSSQKRADSMALFGSEPKDMKLNEYYDYNEADSYKGIFYSFNPYCNDFILMTPEGETLMKSSNPGEISDFVRQRERVEQRYTIDGRCKLLIKHCNMYCTYSEFSRAVIRGPISSRDSMWQDNIENSKATAKLECAWYP